MSSTAKWVTGISIVIVLAVLWYFLDHSNKGLIPTESLINESYGTSTTATQPASGANPSQTTTTTTTSNSSAPMKNFSHQITIVTSKGTIVFETYDADAPNTVKNFLTLTDKGFYNGTIFHRVIEGFMIQGGDPTGTGRGGPGYQFADELNPSTPSYKTGYARGTVAMANSGPDTNGSQFFIMQADQSLPHNYTIFGRVISGMEVVDAIARTPRDSADKPMTPVTMTKVTETTVAAK